MARMPLFEVHQSTEDEKTFSVEIDNIQHTVVVEEKGSGSYFFRVDDGIEQSCHGHPVLTPQAPGVPPAAVISIVKGPKGRNIPWMTYWE